MSSKNVTRAGKYRRHRGQNQSSGKYTWEVTTPPTYTTSRELRRKREQQDESDFERAESGIWTSSCFIINFCPTAFYSLGPSDISAKFDELPRGAELPSS